MTLAIIFDQLQNTVAVLVLSSLVLTGVRRIQKISRPLGTILAVGVIARMAVGLALFWTSYLNLPILESLQAGNGFWQVALDARSYYETAASAAESGRLVALDHSSASPFFLNTLAVWMMLVGISPAAAMFLNLCLYVLLMMGIAWTFKPVNDWRRDLPVLVCTAAYSFSPVIVIHSTQPLKDELAAVLVGLTCVAVAWLARLMNSVQPRRLEWPVLIATLVFAFSIFGVAGTRWYYGFVLWCSLALVFGIFALGRRTVPLPRYLTACFLVLLVSWFGFREGAGPYYDAVTPSLDGRFAWQSAAVDPSEPKKSGISALLGRLANVPTYFAERTSAARTGFVMSGGATNVLVSVRHESTPPLAASPGSPSGSTPASSGVATVSRSAPLIAAVPPLPSGFDANEAFASATPSVEVAVAGIGAPTVFVSTASMPAAPEAAAAASSIASDSTIARSAPVTLAAATGDVPAAMATGRDPNTFEPVPVADPTANLAASDGLASPPSLLVAVSPPAATLNGQQSAVTTSAPPATSGATPQAEVAMPVGTLASAAVPFGPSTAPFLGATSVSANASVLGGAVTGRPRPSATISRPRPGQSRQAATPKPPTPTIAAPSAPPLAAAAPSDKPAAVEAIPRTAAEHLKAVIAGVGVIFLPISLVTALWDIELPGGRGLLPLSELDTIFLDVTIMFLMGLLWQRRKLIGDRLPMVMYGFILSSVSAVLIGYVVTNFGTLWRMRPLVALPLWMLALALAPRPGGEVPDGEPWRESLTDAGTDQHARVVSV